MKVIPIDKTFENVLDNINTYDLYFLKLHRMKTKSGSDNQVFRSARVGSISMDEIMEYIKNPDFALVKIEEAS